MFQVAIYWDSIDLLSLAPFYVLLKFLEMLHFRNVTFRNVFLKDTDVFDTDVDSFMHCACRIRPWLSHCMSFSERNREDHKDNTNSDFLFFFVADFDYDGLPVCRLGWEVITAFFTLLSPVTVGSWYLNKRTQLSIYGGKQQPYLAFSCCSLISALEFKLN